jgi:hypothetical protein
VINCGKIPKKITNKAKILKIKNSLLSKSLKREIKFIFKVPKQTLLYNQTEYTALKNKETNKTKNIQ